MVVKFLILAIVSECISHPYPIPQPTDCHDSVTYGQTEPTASDVLKALPADLQGAVNETQIQDIQKNATLAFKEKCEKNGGPDAYGNAEAAFKDLTKCIGDLVNFNTLKEEIEENKSTGRVDEVFKKYCDKRPSLLGCFHNMTEEVKPCLTVDERENLKLVDNVTMNLVDFVCFKDGDRIALFIAEGGPECLNEKNQMITKCFNDTFGVHKFNPNEPYSIPEIKFGEKECNQLTELQKCVIKALETCSVPTSANIFESLFKFARKSLPCKEVPENDDDDLENQNAETTKDPNSGSRVALTTLTVAAAIFVPMLV